METNTNRKTSETQISTLPKRSDFGGEFRAYREWQYRLETADCVRRSEQHR